jgi:toxin ParE1/3/4
MTGFVLRPHAQRDVEEIWDYTAEKWDSDQAEIYILSVKRTLEMLADDPRLGRACEEIRAGYRKHRTGSHIVFYRALNDGIEIVRILHQSMDCKRHM